MIRFLVVELYGYVVQFRTYQGARKENRLPPLLNGD